MLAGLLAEQITCVCEKRFGVAAHFHYRVHKLMSNTIPLVTHISVNNEARASAEFVFNTKLILKRL